MSSEQPIDRELNLKGVVCPYNFVKTKLAIEDLALGQVLRVVVDFPTAPSDVSRGMEMEGQKVLRLTQLNEHDWEIVIQKQK